MGKRATWLSVTTFLALITTIGASGTGVFEAAKAAWLFLKLVTEDMPLGVGNAILALVLCVLEQAVLRRWLPHRTSYNKHTRTFLIEASALVLGVFVMMFTTQEMTMVVLLAGVIQGLAAPFIYRGLAAGICAARKVPSEAPEQE